MTQAPPQLPDREAEATAEDHLKIRRCRKGVKFPPNQDSETLRLPECSSGVWSRLSSFCLSNWPNGRSHMKNSLQGTCLRLLSIFNLLDVTYDICCKILRHRPQFQPKLLWRTSFSGLFKPHRAAVAGWNASSFFTVTFLKLIFRQSKVLSSNQVLSSTVFTGCEEVLVDHGDGGNMRPEVWSSTSHGMNFNPTGAGTPSTERRDDGGAMPLFFLTYLSYWLLCALVLQDFWNAVEIH